MPAVDIIDVIRKGQHVAMRLLNCSRSNLSQFCPILTWYKARTNQHHSSYIHRRRKGSVVGGTVASAEHEPITGVWGQSPQRGPGAEPLVRGSGGRSPLKLKAFWPLDVQRSW